jgi:hypothetical protein
LLSDEENLWLSRSFGKTLTCIVKCKSTTEMTCSFIREDNFKAALLTLMKHDDFVNDLKRAFRRRKAQLKQALHLYGRCMKAMQLWNENIKI